VVRRAACVGALVALALPAAASAHAVLQGTTPERGATVHHPPEQVVLRFNEPVEGNFGAIRVFDRRSQRVEEGKAFHPAGRGAELAVRLKSGLPEGTYTATYRVVSADSHPVSGGFTFNVGAASQAGASVDDLLEGGGAGSITATTLGAARAVQYAAIALALGTLIFVAVSWLPALRELAGGGAAWRAASAAFAGRARVLLIAAGGAGLVSGAAGLVLQGATASGGSFWSALDSGVIGDVLDTRFGTVWGLGILAWAAVLGLAAAPRGPLPELRPASIGATGLALPSSRTRLIALAIPVALLAALPGLGGHAGVQDPRVLMLGTNVVHVLSMGAWLGGIAVLVIAMRAATARLELQDRTRLLAATVARFSALAGIAIAALLASGIVQALVSLTAVDDLLDTAFGRAVLIKAGLFSALVSIGWVNRNRLLPRLRRAASDGEPPGRTGLLLRRTLRGEAALGVAVLAVTGGLATYAPPDSQSAASGPFSASEELGPARLEATVDPARVGPNEVHLYLFSRRDGRQYDALKQMRVLASLPDKGIGPLELHVHKGGPGHYVISGASFGASGDWSVEAIGRVSEFDEYRAQLEVHIR
jgi:copper transport protein